MPARKDPEWFKQEVFRLVGDEFTVLGEYRNNKDPIKMRHEKCSKEIEMIPKNFIRLGNRCVHCAGLKKKSTEEFKKDMLVLVGNEYEVVSEYVNNKTKVKLRHAACGLFWDVAPHYFLRGTRCAFCNGNLATKKTTGQFKKEVHDQVVDKYTVLGEYVTNDTKVLLRHEKCGKTFEMTPNHFLSKGNRCLCESQSRGERAVQKFLDAHLPEGCHSVPEIKLDGCRNKRPLPFDNSVWRLKDCEMKLVCLIEFDGIQHFEPAFGSTPEERQAVLERFRLHDQIKDTWCQDNGILLVRISSLDEVDTILEEKLSCLLRSEC